MNPWYARFFGPDGHPDCPICRFEAQQELGPVQGCELPPKPGVERWSMSPDEWAGGWL